ncbi:hypothetical protein V22_19040 [Calycomorphotria hydatis]|uniref:Uncharacterized protein n=1 Tax=Calycomorphotria hydatis TaxID=2528027 RepID=A0A517T8F3_9PLAN|nr:hypothetical protein V22_19040 [Calycomorphotria hydatis]
MTNVIFRETCPKPLPNCDLAMPSSRVSPTVFLLGNRFNVCSLPTWQPNLRRKIRFFAAMLSKVVLKLCTLRTTIRAQTITPN